MKFLFYSIAFALFAIFFLACLFWVQTLEAAILCGIFCAGSGMAAILGAVCYTDTRNRKSA